MVCNIIFPLLSPFAGEYSLKGKKKKIAAYEINNIVMFHDNKKTAAGKIIDLDDKNVIINTS